MSTVNTITNDDLLINRYSTSTKTVLEEALGLDKHVKWMEGEFPDGNSLKIPTFGQMTVEDYAEGDSIQTQALNSGEYLLTINEYIQAGVQVTEKFRQDAWYGNMALAEAVRGMNVAFVRHKDSKIAHLQAQQTANDPNTLSGANHRFVSAATNNVLGIEDFRLAKHSLAKANSYGRRIAFIDPDCVYELSAISSLYDQTLYGANAALKEGSVSGNALDADDVNRNLFGRVCGFDTYEYQVLDYGLAETIVATGKNAGSRSVTSAYANLFLGKDTFIGAVRSAPAMQTIADPLHKSDIIHATMRYDVDLFRPESLVVVLADVA